MSNMEFRDVQRMFTCTVVISLSFRRVMKWITALIFIIIYSKTFYVQCKIIRVGHHFFAPFTLIDSNKRLIWRDPYCVQNLTDKATVYECVGACVLNKNCTTFNYHRQLKICELLNMSKFDALGILQCQPGWIHYETDDDARLMGPACNQLNPCKSHEICEDTFTSKLYTCKCQEGFIGAKCEAYVGPGFNKSVPAPACSLLMKHYKSIPDGEYWIQRRNGSVFQKNCTQRGSNEFQTQSPTPSIASTKSPPATMKPNTVDSTLLVHLQFDHIVGNKVQDQSSYGNNAVMSGNTSIVKTQGKPYYALKLSQGDHFTINGKKMTKKPRKAITIAVWVKLNGKKIGYHSIFFTKGDSHTMGQYHLEIKYGSVRWFHRNENRKEIFNIKTAEVITKISKWYHIASMYDSSARQASVYINGEKVAEGNGNGLLSEDWNQRVGFGSLGEKDHPRFLNGEIGDVRIYNVALTANKVKELARNV